MFEAALLEALGDEDQLRALAPFISELGDMASLKGAAWVAAGRHGSSGSRSDQPVRAIRTDLQNAT